MDENARSGFSDDENEPEIGEDEERTLFDSDCDADALATSEDDTTLSYDTTRRQTSSSSSCGESELDTPNRSLASDDFEPQRAPNTNKVSKQEMDENFRLRSTDIVNAEVGKRTSMLWLATDHRLKDMRFVLVDKKHKNDPYVAGLIRDPLVSVLFSVVKIEVMFATMHSRDEFGQFNLGTPSGNASATLLSLFGEAFSDPSIGSLRFAASSGGLCAQTGCYTFELHGERRSKGIVFFEMLCADDYGFPAKSRAQQLENAHVFYSHYQNTLGYRMVVGFCDPEVKPDNAIGKRIFENCLLAGAAPKQVKIDINSDSSREILRETFDNDMERFEAYAERYNKKVNVHNANTAKTAAATKDWIPTEAKDYHRQITDCRLYRSFAIAPYYSFSELHAGDPLSATLADSDLSDSAVQEVVGCHVNFAIETQEAVERLLDYGVCESQSRMETYLSLSHDAPANIIAKDLRFPMPVLVYCTAFLPHIRPSVLFALPFPWAIYPIEVALRSHKDMLKSRQENQFLEVDAEALQTMRPEDVQYFADVSDAHAGRHDEMVLRHVRLPNDIAAVDSDYYVKSIGGIIAPTSKKAEEENSNVFRVVMPIDEATHKYLAWMDELEPLIPTLSEEARLEFIKHIEQSGGRLLQSVFNTQHRHHIKMMSAAITFLRRKEQKGETIYHESQTTFDELGVFGSYMAEHLLTFTEVIGLTNNADVVNDTRMYAYRVVHSHLVERANRDPGDKNQILFYGAPATGKTHSGDELEKHCWLPGTKENNMTMSERANNTYGARGGVFYKDEADATIDPSLATTPQSQTLLAQTKSAITNHEVCHTVLTMNPDAKGKSSIHERQVAHLTTPMPAVRLCAVNNRVIGDEPSYATRWQVTYFKYLTDNRDRTRLLNAVMPIVNGDSNQDPRNIALLFYKELCHKEQAFHTLAASAIAVGKLPYPNTQLLRIYWHVIAGALVNDVPTLLDNIRASATYLQSYALVLTVNTAVRIVMGSECSPLLEFNRETGESKPRPFDLEQVGLLKPYLFMHESAAIFAITRYMNLYILPAEWYIVAESVARCLCSFFVSNAPSNNEPNYEVESMPNGTSRKVISIVKWSGSKDHLLKTICSSTGHTLQTADEIVGLLGKAKVRTPWVYANADSANGVTSAGMREVPFMEYKEEPGVFGKTVTVRVSTFYLIDLSPSKLMEKMLKTVSHRGMRQRQIITGAVNPNMPSTFITATLGRGSHTLRVAQSCVMNKAKQNVFFGGGLTAEKRSIMPDIGGTMIVDKNEIIFDGDVETILYSKWARSVGIVDENEISAFMPKTVDADIRHKHRAFSAYHGKIVKNYPDGLIDKDSQQQQLTQTARPRPGEIQSSTSRSGSALSAIWDRSEEYVQTMAEKRGTESPLSLISESQTETISISKVTRSSFANPSSEKSALDAIRGTATVQTSNPPSFLGISGQATRGTKRPGGKADASPRRKHNGNARVLMGEKSTKHAQSSGTANELSYFNIAQ